MDIYEIHLREDVSSIDICSSENDLTSKAAYQKLVSNQFVKIILFVLCYLFVICEHR